MLVGLAVHSTPRTNELVSVGDDMDKRYFSAVAHGDEGDSFLKKLQNMWFVTSNKGLDGIAKDAEGIAATLQTAAFPEDVKKNINLEVNPCDDFYEFACGGWSEENHDSIPAFQTSWALSWDRAQLEIQDKMIEVLEKDDGPAGMYYKSCANIDRINEQGWKPLEPWFDLIDTVKDADSLLNVVVEFNKANLDMFFSWYVDTDSHDNSQNAFFLTQGDISMPDRSYLLEDSEEMKEHRKIFEDRISAFFKLVGREEHEAEAKKVLEYEIALANALDDHTVAYKQHAKVISWEEVEKLTPNWPWKEWLTGLAKCTEPFNGTPKMCTDDHPAITEVGTPQGKPLYIRDPDFFPKLNTMIKDTPMETVRAVMRWKVVNSAASSLSTEFEDTMLEWYKDLYGVQERSARPRKCFYSTTGSVAWASAKLYVDKLFHHENRDAALAMLEKVRGQFKLAIPHADWMTPKNRDDAIHKLEEMFFQVGIPTDAENEEAWPKRANALDGKLTDDYFHNGEVSTRLSLERALNKLTRTPKRRAWGGSTPLEVNAFYGPKSNGLWIPAGILQAPFFDAANSDAQNYGSVGTILGHEMSHGFDDDGRRYDARGEMKDWWEPATVEGFKERSKCISDLFSSYKVMDKEVNGVLTLGEDIADAGGLKFAYRAFMDEQRSQSDERLFFTAFAQTWCEVDRKKSAITSVLTDEHAPGKFRVIGGLTQFKPFADAFQCPEGSPMAPKDSDRCHLW